MFMHVFAPYGCFIDFCKYGAMNLPCICHAWNPGPIGPASSYCRTAGWWNPSAEVAQLCPAGESCHMSCGMWRMWRWQRVRLYKSFDLEL